MKEQHLKEPMLDFTKVILLFGYLSKIMIYMKRLLQKLVFFVFDRSD